MASKRKTDLEDNVEIGPLPPTSENATIRKEVKKPKSMSICTDDHVHVRSINTVI
jgi:hypothetical protein